MARSIVTHSQPGTVAHGTVLRYGKLEPASFEIDGSRLSAKSAEVRIRKTLDNTFNIDSEAPVTYYTKVYTMPITEFLKLANLSDILEK